MTFPPRCLLAGLLTSGALAQEAVLDAIGPYEPVYFLFQPQPLTAKFQYSLAVRLIAPPVGAEPVLGRRDGLYVSYSQTSLWDLHGESKPFFDNSYRPECWYHYTISDRFLAHAAIEGGSGHESNGRDGSLSRSFNHVFLRPILVQDLSQEWHLDLHPRVKAYVTDLSENPDIARYRGYVDVEAAITHTNGLGLAFQGRMGNEWDRSSLQADLTYPLTSITRGWVSAFLHVQAFQGWGETLRGYNEHTSRGLVGVSFVR